MSRGRLWVVVLAASVALGPVAVADSVSDRPDNVASDALGTLGANPCPRADIIEAQYQEGEDGTVWLGLHDLGAQCYPRTFGTFRYELEYRAFEGSAYTITMEVRWADGDVAESHLFIVQEGGGSASAHGVEENIHGDNSTLELPAPGDPPLEEAVFRSYVDTGNIVGDYFVQGDRMPDAGSTTLGGSDSLG